MNQTVINQTYSNPHLLYADSPSSSTTNHTTLGNTGKPYEWITEYRNQFRRSVLKSDVPSFGSSVLHASGAIAAESGNQTVNQHSSTKNLSGGTTQTVPQSKDAEVLQPIPEELQRYIRQYYERKVVRSTVATYASYYLFFI